MGVIPPKVFDLLLTNLRQSHELGIDAENLKFRFEIPLVLLDKIKLKNCKICNRKFFRRAKKWLSGSVENFSFSTSFTCKTCNSIASSENSNLGTSTTGNTDSC